MPHGRDQLPVPLPRIPLQPGPDGRTAAMVLPGDPPVRIRAAWAARERRPEGTWFTDLAWHCSACGGAGCVHAAFLFASLDRQLLPGEDDPDAFGPPPAGLALAATAGGATGDAAAWLAADPDAAPGEGERLVVKLVERRDGGGLGLAPVVARPVRDGLAEVRPLRDLDRLRLRAVGKAESVRYLDRRGMDLAAALGRLDHRGHVYRDGLAPDGAAGAEAAALALDGGDLVWAMPDPDRPRGAEARTRLVPMSRVAARPLGWRWAPVEGGWRVVPDAGGPDVRVAWSTPPLAVDPPRRTAWVAETALTTPQLRWLRTMPVLDPDQALAQWPRLAALIPDLPAPPAGDMPPAVGVPELWLWHGPGRFAGPPVAQALPLMRYPGGTVAMGSGGLRLPDGSVRSATAESAALAELRSAGLVPAGALAVPPPGVPAAALWTWPEDTEPARRSRAVRDLGLRGWALHGAPAAARAVVVPAVVEGDAAVDGDGFTVAWALRAGDERIDLAPVLAELVAGGPEALAALPRTPAGEVLVEAGPGRVAAVPADQLADLLRLVLSLHGIERGRSRVARAQAAAVLDLAAGPLRGEGRLAAAAAAIRAAAAAEPVAAPRGFAGELRPYQAAGVGWMQRLAELGLGGVLADDMGLGKTVQVLALLADRHAAGRLDGPVLVVAPTSLLATWADGARRFAPDLPCAVHHGDGRGDPPAAGLVVTTYGVLVRDEARFAARRFALAVFDEAQAVRNRDARAARACARIDAGARFCLTGTPVENHLGELWAIMALAVPGLLGSERGFARAFQRPIEVGDGRAMDQLRGRLRPFLLRRTKDQVAPELPPRTELVRRIELDPGQRALYEAIRLSQHEAVRAAIRERGLARSRIDVLAALLRLRQCCCDPGLVPRSADAPPAGSAKREEL
ncbi:MAG: hypothetical protein RLZZ127_354, partial [Planctomycetota bacterium]